jgi:hypothetical protein
MQVNFLEMRQGLGIIGRHSLQPTSFSMMRICAAGMSRSRHFSVF